MARLSVETKFPITGSDPGTESTQMTASTSGPVRTTPTWNVNRSPEEVKVPDQARSASPTGGTLDGCNRISAGAPVNCTASDRQASRAVRTDRYTDGAAPPR